MTPIRVIICDDDVFIRDSLKIIVHMQPDMEVVATCSNGLEALAAIQQHNVDLILMDIRMPICDGVEGTRLIKQAHSRIHVLILTTFDDEQYIAEALSNGASGYLLKNSSPERLIEAIRTVHTGNVLIDPEAARKLAAMLQHRTIGKAVVHKETSIPWDHWRLSTSEQAIILHISNGLTNKEIANTLFLSEGTIKNYVTDILAKLELRDRTQLAIWYWKQRSS